MVIYCAAGCTEIGMDGEVAVYNPNTRQRRTFKYDRVFGPESSQAEVYEDTKALIRSVLDGEIPSSTSRPFAMHPFG